MNRDSRPLFLLIAAAAVLFVLFRGGGEKTNPTPEPPPSADPIYVYFVYETNEHAIPPHVELAFNKLNARTDKPQTVASLLEDVTDSSTPLSDKHKAVLDAAKEFGLPTLSIMRGDQIESATVPDTEEAIIEKVLP